MRHVEENIIIVGGGVVGMKGHSLTAEGKLVRDGQATLGCDVADSKSADADHANCAAA